MVANLVQFARELKNQIPIEQVIGDSIPNLRRVGRNYKGLCPFHDEKTPSFHVNPEMGIYKCFGCQASGDVIKFVQEFEKIDFRLAVESLARRFNVPIPEFEREQTGEQRDEAERTRQTLLAVCKLAEAWFIGQLWNHAAAGAAREYLHSRGLSDQQIRDYRLGFAPAEYEAFLREAKRRGYSAARVAEAGLAIQKDNGRFMDRFRNRIIFPITDPAGQVVAFGGRLMEGEGPKYLNSSDSPIFHKGKLLYGLASAREAIRDEKKVILLEGYMDWIALHSHGLRNALAGLGTAFTEDHARYLRRITAEVVLHYDGDEAGQNASYKAAAFLLAQGLKVRVADLPADDDPDSFIRKNGADASRALLENAKPAMDFFLERAMRSFPTTKPEGKSEAVEFLSPLLSAIRDPVLNDAYLHRTAGRFGLDAAVLRKALAKRKGDRVGDDSASQKPAASRAEAIDRCELGLLHLLLFHVERLEFFERIDAALFAHELTRALFNKIWEKAQDIREGESRPENWLVISSSDEEKTLLTEILFLESRLAGGEFKIPEGSLGEDRIARSVEELRIQLRRKRSRQDRAAQRARTTSSGFEDNRDLKAAIHHVGELVVQEHNAHFGDGD